MPISSKRVDTSGRGLKGKGNGGRLNDGIGRFDPL
jgi:hypothetical protein